MYLLIMLKLKVASLPVSRKVLLNQFIRVYTGGADDDGGSLCSKILHSSRAHVPRDDSVNPQIVKPIGEHIRRMRRWVQDFLFYYLLILYMENGKFGCLAKRWKKPTFGYWNGNLCDHRFL
jgi:hypothetical protein